MRIQVGIIFLYGIRAKIDPLSLNPSFGRPPSPPLLLLQRQSTFTTTMDSKLHPTLTVSNIKTHIPIILEKDSTHYTTWKTLFKVHCQAYEVLEHLSPTPEITHTTESSDTTSAAKVEAEKLAAKTLWTRLDAIVLQWIYATISSSLLHIILKPGQTAHEAWLAVESEFNDNKNTRAIFLGQEFANLCLENFSSMTEYCQHTKHLVEQLETVGCPIDNRMLVVKILTGLTEQYDGISTVLQNRDPLPDFNEVRSRLNMEEQKKQRYVTRTAQTAATALATTTTTTPPNNSQQQHHQNSPYQDRGRGRGRSSRGQGRGRSSHNRNNNPTQQNPSHPYIVFPSNWTNNQWAGFLNQNSPATPPFPYPSKPNPPANPDILGPRPDHAYITNHTPTDIEQALYTISLNSQEHDVIPRL